MFEDIQDQEQRKKTSYFADMYRKFYDVLQRKCFEYGAEDELDKSIHGVIFGVTEYEHFNGNIPFETYIEQDPELAAKLKLIEGYQKEEEVIYARSVVMETLIGGLEYGISSKEDITKYKIKLEKEGLTDSRFGYSERELMVIAGLKREYKKELKEKVGHLTKESGLTLDRDLEALLDNKEPSNFEEAKRQEYIRKRKEILSEIDFMRIRAYQKVISNYDLAYQIAKETFEEVLNENKEQVSKLFERIKGDKK